jgi:3-deoxy-D-manno-octulosonic-acid transferase
VQTPARTTLDPAAPDRRSGLLLSGYMALMRLATPLAPLLLRRRLARGKEEPARMGEKLGRASLPRPEGALVWLHAVGVGEVLALPALVAALRAARPGLQVLITSSSRTSAAALAPNMPEGARHQFLPLDCPAFARRFLDHWRPGLSVWAERDVWPALIVETRRRGIPLALVNGRMNAASYRAKARARAFFAALYGQFDHVGVQDAVSARHFAALGVAARVTGSLKAAARPLADHSAVRAANARALAGRRVWLAASTHPGEEELVAAAHLRLRAQDPGACLIVAPRDPARAGEVCAVLSTAGLEATVLPADGRLPELPGAAHVVGQIGQLGLWYRLADAAFVGGSLVPVGGHNPYEAALLDCAVLHGPHVANFADDYGAFHAAGAAHEVSDATALAAALGDAPSLEAMRAAAREAATRGEDNLQREAQRLLALMDRGPA